MLVKLARRELQVMRTYFRDRLRSQAACIGLTENRGLGYRPQQCCLENATPVEKLNRFSYLAALVHKEMEL